MRAGPAMKLVFSRKGFDSASGGFPSPIVDGVPVSLPIPAKERSHTTYADLGLGTLVEHVTGRRLTGANLCHCDPMFENGRCAFGQIAAAQSHLANNGVSVGDVFLFFGLFSESTVATATTGYSDSCAWRNGSCSASTQARPRSRADSRSVIRIRSGGGRATIASMSAGG